MTPQFCINVEIYVDQLSTDVTRESFQSDGAEDQYITNRREQNENRFFCKLFTFSHQILDDHILGAEYPA